MKNKVNTSEKKMRIAVDARPLSTPVSGVGKLIESVLKGFSKDLEFEFLLFSHRQIHEDYSALLSHPNIKPVIGTGILAQKGGLYFGLYLPLQIRKYGIDLFWGTQQVFPPFLPKRIPGILTYHDLVVHRFPNTMRKIARFQQLFYLKRSIRRADLILANSEFTASEIQKYYSYPKDKIRIVYPGYDPKETIVLKKPPSERISRLPKKYFLTVSTLEPRKNFSTLWKAYKAAKEEFPKFQLHWVHAGKEGWDSTEFLAEFRKASESGILTWIESPNHAELTYLYSHAELFLFPSIYEGFGIPLLEALAYSLPCIVSDLEVFREIGDGSCKYVPAESVPDWKKSILEFGKKAWKGRKSNLKRFERKISAKKTREAFLELLSNP